MVYGAVESFLEKNNFNLVRAHILVSGWPKAKRIAPDDVKDIISRGGGVKSLEGEFAGGGARIELLIRPDSSPILYVGLEPPDEEFLVRFIRHMAQEIDVSYGYFFSATKEAAALYAVGITQCGTGEGAELPDQDADARWFNERVLPRSGHRYKDQGFFRNIYPYNLINNNHLSVLVDGVTLEAKIRSANWGGLVRVGDMNWLWRVPPNSTSEIRAAIARSGHLI